MSNHAWCRDVARDEAVRAAEDGRDRPLPTLKECIAGVTESMSVDARGEEMEQGNFAHAVERSVEVSETVNGQSQLRTERVTLEVTHDLDARLSDWIVEVVDESLGLMESVRVVEDCCIDHINMGEVLRQRDAAIRERDALQARVAELEAASGGGERAE